MFFVFDDMGVIDVTSPDQVEEPIENETVSADCQRQRMATRFSNAIDSSTSQ